jgi:hypothetical protein
MRDTVRELQGQLEAATSQRVTMTFGGAGDLRRRLQAGETADVIILPRIVMDQAVADGKVADRRSRADRDRGLLPDGNGSSGRSSVAHGLHSPPSL